eukprot:6236477-Lingulodinium_polyedra.AAC.1
MQSSRELAARLLLTYWLVRRQRGARAGSGAEKLRLGHARPCQVCIPMFMLLHRDCRVLACSCAC